jgi:hypothetical protein
LDPEVRPDVLQQEAFWPTVGVLIIALAVAGIGLVSAIKHHRQQKELARFDPTATPRRQRWFRQGMRPLILCGALGLLIILVERISTSNSQRKRLAEIAVEVQQQQRAAENQPPLTDKAKEGIRKLAATISVKPPLWPVVLAGAAFLYLWWLAALIFDLAFVWQRYIRQSAAIERLKGWWALQVPDGVKPVGVASRQMLKEDFLARAARWWGHLPTAPIESHRPNLRESRAKEST